MKTNTIAPFEGELVWRGEMRQGRSQSGKEWQSVDFVIKFKDGNYDSHLNLQAFGADKVGLIMAAEIGSKLRVEWFPKSREYNGKWYTNAEAKEIKYLGVELEPRRSSATQVPAGAEIHGATGAPTFPNANNATASTEDGPDADLPFSQSPGA